MPLVGVKKVVGEKLVVIAVVQYSILSEQQIGFLIATQAIQDVDLIEIIFQCVENAHSRLNGIYQLHRFIMLSNL